MTQIYEKITIYYRQVNSIEITNGSYIGYFEKRYKYHIVSIDENTMYLAHLYNDDAEGDPAKDANARYFTYHKK